MKLAGASWPLTIRLPDRLPSDLRMASMSMSVDLPAPDGPMSACSSRHTRSRQAGRQA